MDVKVKNDMLNAELAPNPLNPLSNCSVSMLRSWRSVRHAAQGLRAAPSQHLASTAQSLGSLGFRAGNLALPPVPQFRGIITTRCFGTGSSPGPPPPLLPTAWRERFQQWSTLAALAETGDGAALCDVGWAHHMGLVPDTAAAASAAASASAAAAADALATLPPDIGRALKCYEASSAAGYSPAASLLADIHFFGHNQPGGGGAAGGAVPRDLAKAARWLRRVLACSDAAEAGDA